MDALRIADRTFSSRLLTGTGKYASAKELRAVLDASGAEIVTMAVKRVRFGDKDDGILSGVDPARHLVLPNPSGVRIVDEAVS
ncbi:MAG: thiazole synthase, partial [Verrucomicrobiota bacterium]